MIFVTILLSGGFFILTVAQSHDLVLGKTRAEDLIIYRNEIAKRAIPFIVRTKEVQYPKSGEAEFEVIDAIVVKDNFKDGSGGYAFVKKGGIGHTHVTLGLQSQRGGHFNFTVTIYGQPMLI